jgi:transcriptional regulator with XRE-family HTH domain
MNFKMNSFKAQIPVNAVFRCLRMAAGLTTRELAALIDCSPTLITHYEMGNRELPKERVAQLCKAFRINREDLEDYVSGRRPVPISYQDECILILSKLDKVKLQAVYGILVSMAG